MRAPLSRLPAAWLLLALGAPAHAEPAAEATGPEILVLGRGLPAGPGMPAYGSVTLEAARLSDVGRLELALQDVAGFQQFRRSDSRSANPSAQGATLRALGGNAASRTLVVLDGVPVADPFFGHIPFTALGTEPLAAVRVTRGGGAGAFAAGAVAGTIELIGAGRADLPGVMASAEGGSYGSVLVGGGLTADLGQGFVHASLRHERSDGFFTAPEDQRVAASVPAANRSTSASLRAVVPLSATAELQARALLFRDARTLRFDGADSTSEGQDVSLRLVTRGRWQVEALGYLQLRDFSNIVISAATFRPTLDQRQTPSTGLGGKLELRPPMPDGLSLRAGADLRMADGEMAETAFNATTGAVTARRRAGGRQLSAGLFLEQDWQPTDGLTLTGGLRLDHWAIRDGRFESRSAAGTLVQASRFADRSDWRVNGRAGVQWKPAAALALRAAAYTNHRLPTLNELYRPFTVFPVTTQANADLQPERLRGFEAGADYEPLAALRLSATLFDNRVDDAIANVTIAPNLRQRRNVEAIAARGLELAAALALGPVTLSGSWSGTDSRVRAPGTALDGLRPAQTPSRTATATLGWTPGPRAALSATLRHVGAQYEDDLETDRLPAATTVELFARHEIAPGLSVRARIENLFDAQVVTRNAGGSIDLGAPRMLWLGLRLER